MSASRSVLSLLFMGVMAAALASAADVPSITLPIVEVREIADLRCVEMVTVKTQIKSLLRKFHCTRSKEIVEMVRSLHIDHLF